ncbi:MAG: MarR family transcriptional regulator [Pseudonocardiales bacterium]|nr:MarR family transcriptional regulator [Pseudonocardiales bacterium]
MDTEGLAEELGGFADEVGLFYEGLGSPRVWGRVLGWLLVAQPDLQSADDLAMALHVSKGSISMATQALVRWNMVERQTVRGDRRTYYRIRPGAWTLVFEDQTRMATKLRELAERGLELLNSEPGRDRSRLEELHDLTTFYEQESPALLALWRERRQHTSGQPR